MRRNKDFNQFNRESEAIPALSVLNERETMEAKIKKIRELNDNLRQTFTGGRVLITRGVAELPTDKQLEIMERVKNFNQFTKNNDPNGEHDFGAFDIDGIKDLVTLMSRLPDIYNCSNNEEKRKILKLIFSNMEMKGKNCLFSKRKPVERLLSSGRIKTWQGQ